MYVADNVDYARVKLFVVSVLWRASVSTLPFYRRVDLREAVSSHIVADGSSGSMSLPAHLLDFVIAHGKPLGAVGVPLSGSHEIEIFRTALLRRGARQAERRRRRETP